MKKLSTLLILALVLCCIPLKQIKPESGTKKDKTNELISKQTKKNSLNKTQSLPPCGELLVPYTPGDLNWVDVTSLIFVSRRGQTLIPISLGFAYHFYGTDVTQCYVATNGVLSMNAPFNYGNNLQSFAATNNTNKMIAGYWSDVDISVSGHIYYKREPHRFTVLYNRVGQYGGTAAKQNTFEIILTDGTDPLIGVGNNLGFSYGDMQWVSIRHDATSEKSEIGAKCTLANSFKVASFNNETTDEFNGRWDDSGLQWLSYRNTSCNGLDANLNYDISKFSVTDNGMDEGGTIGISGYFMSVSWTTLADFPMNIDFSSDGGNTWLPWGEGIPSLSLGCLIYCPHVNSENCYLRIYDASDSAHAVKAGPFTVKDYFNILTPQNGDVYTVNSVKQINWTIMEAGRERRHDGNNNPLTSNSLLRTESDDPHLSVRLDYSTNNGEDWISVNDSIPLQVNVTNYVYNWTVPQTPSDKCKFRVKLNPFGDARRPNDYDIYSESDGNFSIVNPVQINGQITLTTPNGGETYTGGSYNYISWRRTGLVPGSQSLELSTDGGSTWNKISSVPIAGVMRYSWLAPKINANKCLVRICNAITGKEYDRSNSYFSIVTPTLLKNYPNPFNPTTRISFSLERNAYTTLRVYNTIGQQVAELVNRELKAGMYEYEFNAQNLPSGVYLYNLTVDGKSQINKMMLLK